VFALLVLASSTELFARPGAGQSYSGSSNSSYSNSSSSSSSSSSSYGSGDSSSGDGEALGALIGLAIENPALGVPLLCGFLLFVFWKHRKEHISEGWYSSGTLKRRMNRASAEMDAARFRSHSQNAMRAKLEHLRRYDQDFSLIIFEDFLDALYREAHLARGRGELKNLSPFLSKPARQRLAKFSNAAVDSVLVGALRFVQIEDLNVDSRPIKVSVEFESNYSEVEADSKEAITYYARERWVLQREKTARSRAPERARVFDCPNCGAPTDRVVNRKCGYCNEVVDTGEHDWLVAEVISLEREQRPPALTGNVQERGTDLPTIIDPQSEARFEALYRRDPELSWSSFQSRVELIFRELQQAWSAQDLEPARAFLSDNLYESWQYWVDAYKRAGLRNSTESARVVQIIAARVSRDKYYDAITVRVFATGLDYTVNSKGKLVTGSKKRERAYSEYWTLMRGRAVTGRPKSDLACPNCGGPLRINMAGVCEYCQVKVTAGEFDWVLSRVEQDESY
jgi:predicted lipid-binding transport protein (Tim44 family)